MLQQSWMLLTYLWTCINSRAEKVSFWTSKYLNVNIKWPCTDGSKVWQENTVGNPHGLKRQKELKLTNH
jgi:hypothetical protein